MNQCPLCGKEDFTVIYKQPDQYPDADIVRCNQCGHRYSVLRKEVNTNALYADEIYKVVENRDSVFDRIIEKEYTQVIRQLSIFKPARGSLLDFGCGKGKFGSLAKEKGWQVKCVETSPERAEYAAKVYGLDVSTEFYSGGSIFDISFDVLTLFHVLEHLPHPKTLLAGLIKDNLKADGLLVIEVPNIKSWQSGIAGGNWIHLDVPRHIHHFTPERLEQFAREIGFKPVKKTFFSFHLGVLGMVDSLLKLLGYKKNIIYELKNKKSKILILKIALVFPVAWLMEHLACAMGKGGVIRLYLGRK